MQLCSDMENRIRKRNRAEAVEEKGNTYRFQYGHLRDHRLMTQARSGVLRLSALPAVLPLIAFLT